MPWSNYAKDRFFFPKLSQLNACGAPLLAIAPVVSADWIVNFALNSVGRNIPDPTRQLMFNFMRRVDRAVLEYTRGREALTELIECRTHVDISRYSRCLDAFDAAVAMTYQGYLLAKQLIPGKPRLFEKQDGSVLSRIDRIYNASKHADEFIANGNRFAPESTLTVWIINTGLESRDAVLTFVELAEEIQALGTLAEQLSGLDQDVQAVSQSEDSTHPIV